MVSENFDVTQQCGAGRLDELREDETTADLQAILCWIRATRTAVEINPARTPPNVARAVLTKYWQEPRTKFHEANLNGRRKDTLGNKLTLVPWSVQAFDQYNQSGSIEGLVTEHVTPIQAMWTKLTDLLDKEESDSAWVRAANTYLLNNFTIAIVTKRQADAIDTIMKMDATEDAPFERYRLAAEQIRVRREAGETDVVLDITQFVHPAFREGTNATEALVDGDDELAQTDAADVIGGVRS